jgi:hypothetical protein
MLAGFVFTGIALSFPSISAPASAPSSPLSPQPAAPQAYAAPAELKGGFRLPQKNGWTFVHLQGTPREIGCQNGYLLAPEIADLLAVVKLELAHDNHKDWPFFRDAAQNMMWPHIEEEYRDELQGIADGATAHGVKIDLWDVVAANAFLEWSYYVEEYDKDHGIAPPATTAAPDHCSAFVATGSYTAGGKPVIAHNNWTDYLDGERWTIIYDIDPANGNRILMDGLPGVIHSADDFVVNSAGIVITETTIMHFHGYDPAGIPEFVRARKAAQYSASIDDFARIMEAGNNGGYANTWLIADTRKNEIGRLELGLKNVTLERTTDGYFVGSNFPINPKLTDEETAFNPNDPASSENARHARWDQLMAENKGKIDVAAAERFEAGNFDVIEKKTDPDERTLDGHIDLSPRGALPWQGPFAPAGAVQNKVSGATLAAQMSFIAHAGHANGIDFKAADLLRAHPEFGWEAPLLRDMPAQPWTIFSATKLPTP